MSDFFSKLTPISAAIANLQRCHLSVYIHCSKINSLMQTLKLVQAQIEFERTSRSQIKRSISFKNRNAISNITAAIDQTQYIANQCLKDTCVHYLLGNSIKGARKEIKSIRDTLYTNFDALKLPTVSALFKISKEDMMSQDLVDMKRLSQILTQISLKNRSDASDKISQRFKSLKKIGITTDPGEKQVLTIPDLPSTINLVLKHDDIILGKEIGTGQSGSVHIGHITSLENQEVAVKVLYRRALTQPELESFRREIYALSVLSHPNLLKFYGYTMDPPFYIVTEYMSNGSVFNVLRKNAESLTPTKRCLIALDVARGLDFLHQRNVIHRDLKSLNVLLGNDYRAKICDFGMVRLSADHDDSPKTGLIGTAHWMAPEVLMSSPTYDNKVDVYSYGIFLWELLTGDMPYKDKKAAEIISMVVDGDRPHIPDGTPPKLRDLIVRCWAQEPTNRPNMTKVVVSLEENGCHFPGTDEAEFASEAGIVVGRHKSSISMPGFVEQRRRRAGAVYADSNNIGLILSSTPLIITQQPKTCIMDISDDKKTAANKILFENDTSNINHKKDNENNDNNINNSIIADIDKEKKDNIDVCNDFNNSNSNNNNNNNINLNNNNCINDNNDNNDNIPLLNKSRRNSRRNNFDETFVDILDTSILVEAVKSADRLTQNDIFDQLFVAVNDKKEAETAVKAGFCQVISRVLDDHNALSGDYLLSKLLKCKSTPIFDVNVLKSLLKYADVEDEGLRSKALGVLIVASGLQFDFLKNSPSFISQLLMFLLPPKQEDDNKNSDSKNDDEKNNDKAKNGKKKQKRKPNSFVNLAPQLCNSLLQLSKTLLLASTSGYPAGSLNTLYKFRKLLIRNSNNKADINNKNNCLIKLLPAVVSCISACIRFPEAKNSIKRNMIINFIKNIGTCLPILETYAESTYYNNTNSGMSKIEGGKETDDDIDEESYPNDLLFVSVLFSTRQNETAFNLLTKIAGKSRFCFDIVDLLPVEMKTQASASLYRALIQYSLNHRNLLKSHVNNENDSNNSHAHNRNHDHNKKNIISNRKRNINVDFLQKMKNLPEFYQVLSYFISEGDFELVCSVLRTIVDSLESADLEVISKTPLCSLIVEKFNENESESDEIMLMGCIYALSKNNIRHFKEFNKLFPKIWNLLTDSAVDPSNLQNSSNSFKNSNSMNSLKTTNSTNSMKKSNSSSTTQNCGENLAPSDALKLPSFLSVVSIAKFLNSGEIEYIDAPVLFCLAAEYVNCNSTMTRQLALDYMRSHENDSRIDLDLALRNYLDSFFEYEDKLSEEAKKLMREKCLSSNKVDQQLKDKLRLL